MFLKFNVEVLTDGNRITPSSAIAIKQRNPFVNRDDRSYLLVIHNSLMGIHNYYNLILHRGRTYHACSERSCVV